MITTILILVNLTLLRLRHIFCFYINADSLSQYRCYFNGFRRIQNKYLSVLDMIEISKSKTI